MAAAVLLIWFGLLLGSTGADSQNGIKDTKGKTFTLAFWPEYTVRPKSARRNILYLSSTNYGNCTISYHDDARKTTQVNLVAYEIVKKELPDNTQMNDIGTGVAPKAIYVSCNVEIALYGLNRYQSLNDGGDSFTVLPNSILTSKYLLASADNTAFFGVVATKANTRVSINLKSQCAYMFKNNVYDSGDVLNLTLAYGDVFRIGSSKDHDNCDLGGTEIESSDPVAIFSDRFNSYLGYSIYMVHEVPPLTGFSHEIIIPGVRKAQSNKMSVRVVASMNETNLYITSEPNSGNISANSYDLHETEVLDIDFDPDTNAIIQSNKPIMVVRNVVFISKAGSSLFMPGTNQYPRNALIRSFDLDYAVEVPQATVVTETTSVSDLRVNGVYPSGIQWTNLTSLPYSIGLLSIQRLVSYNVSCTSPILVMVQGVHGYDAYSYVAGYKLANTASPSLKDGVVLKCLPGGWFVAVDLRKLALLPSDVSHVYMSKDSCTGTVQGNLLIFNTSYQDCHTQARVSNGTVSYTNSLIYTRPSAEHLVRDTIWIYDIKCSMPVDGTDTIHLYPKYNATEHGGKSGVIPGTTVHISLYTDATYQHPLPDAVTKAEIGQPVYVQVAAPGNLNVVMVVNSCDAHLEDDKHVSYPLIENGCTVDSRTQILVSRYQVTRFKFEMFDLPREEDGIYVTCHMTFCDPMDFSDRCQQRCHTDPHVGIVG